MPAWSHMCLHILRSCCRLRRCGGGARSAAELRHMPRTCFSWRRCAVQGQAKKFQCQYACGTMLMLPNSCRSCRRTRRCQRWSGRCWRRCATRRDAITRSAPRSSCSPTSRTPGAAPHLLLLPLVVFHGPVRLLCPSTRHLRVRSMNQAVRWHVHLHCRPFAPAHAALFGHHRVGAAVAAKAEARLAELQQSAGRRWP